MYDMYESFYHLQAQPFQLKPDPGFLFYSDKHNRALDYLYYGIYKGEGLIVVTGDVGTGKTMLVYRLLEKLTEQENIIAASLVATQRKAEYLLPMIATAFGLTQEKLSNVILLQRLESFLMNQAQEGKRVVLIVDEAQNLSTQALEMLRLFTNYQFNYKVPLQIFLVGQPEFRNRLHSAPLEPLRQRIIASCHLDPLEADETCRYIEHRLRVVGWQGDPTFTPEAYMAIHHYTHGIPRRINTLCHRVLMLGGIEKKHEINEELINIVIQELEQETFTTEDHVRQYPQNVRILHQQPSGSQESIKQAASNVRPLNLNFQNSNQEQPVSGVQAYPEATTSTAETLAPLVVESQSADSKTANLHREQQTSKAEIYSQQYAFFKRQGLLLALLLLTLTSGGVYLLIHYEGGRSKQSMLVRDNGSALPDPAAPAISSNLTPAVVNLEKPSVGVAERMPIKPQQPMPDLTAERAIAPERAILEPSTQENLTQATQPTTPIPVTNYMHKGDRLMELGDLASARLFYMAAAEAGYALAMTAVGKTYDPHIINRQGLHGIYADPAKAAQWYRQAVQAGDLKAAEYLREFTPLSEGISQIK